MLLYYTNYGVTYLYSVIPPPVPRLPRVISPDTSQLYLQQNNINSNKQRDYSWSRIYSMLQVVTRAQSKQRKQQEQQKQQESTTQTATMATGKNIDFSLCPKFNPKCTDPEAWLEKWNLFHDINKTSEDNKIKYVGLIFDGPLRDWYTSLAANQKDTWENFSNAFTTRFVDKENSWSKVGQIFQQKQKPDQDVREYITNLQKLAAEVELPEKQTIQALIKGVNPKLRPDIQKAEPNTIQEFITAATQAQSIYTDSEDIHTPAVETFISALEPYFKKQIDDLSENLERKIALTVASVSKPNLNTNHQSPRPRTQQHYNAQFQPRHHQFHTRPTLPNPNQHFNGTQTFHTNSWQQSRHTAPAPTQGYRHANAAHTMQYRHTNPSPAQQNRHPAPAPTQQYYPCRGCNGIDHRRRDCPYKNIICTFCGYKGHVEFACGKKQNSQ